MIPINASVGGGSAPPAPGAPQIGDARDQTFGGIEIPRQQLATHDRDLPARDRVLGLACRRLRRRRHQ
ncbi:MAG: hypothetical protein CME06_01520 [Gemmatimonadetes bacterium]|nr:hypothetical protein [Gemmatimonadota bacterium]